MPQVEHQDKPYPSAIRLHLSGKSNPMVRKTCQNVVDLPVSLALQLICILWYAITNLVPRGHEQSSKKQSYCSSQPIFYVLGLF